MAIKRRIVGQKQETPSAVRQFTDREEPRKAFWKQYDKMAQEGSTILVYYGTGGVGKSSLLKKIIEEMDAKNNAQDGKPYKHILCDFNDDSFSNVQDVRTILQDMKSKLSIYGCEFPLFEAGNFYYSVLTGRDAKAPEVKSMIDGIPMLRKIREGLNVAGDMDDSLNIAASILDIGQEVVDAVPVLKAATKIFGFLDRKVVAYMEKHKVLDEVHLEIKQQMNDRIKDRKNPNRLYEYLPTLFAQDICDWEEKTNAKLVIFLDTYEKLGNETSADGVKRSWDLWLRNEDETDDKQPGIILLIPYALWVIAGRNKLRWGGELGKELEGEQTEPESSKRSNQHLIEALSYADSNSFLQTAGVISQELRDGIIKLTGGLPVYLDICVNIYISCRQQQGKEPDISEFGQKRDDVVDRMINHLDTGTKDMICALCALKSWTDEMAARIVPNFSRTVYEEQVKKLSFIQMQEIAEEGLTTTKYNFDRTVHGILFEKYRQGDGYFYKEIRNKANKYFGGTLKRLDMKSRKSSYLLERWADCIVRLTEDADELLAHYEENLAAPLKELGWRGYDTKAYIVNLFFERVAEIGKTDSVPYAFFEYQFSKIKRNRNEYKVAYEYMKSAYEKYVRLSEEKDERSLKVLHSLAKMADYAGHAKESLQLFEKLVKLYKLKYGEKDEKTISIMQDLSYKFRDLKQYEDYLEINHKILSIRKTMYDGMDNEKSLEAMSDVADALERLGRNDEALKINKQELSIRKKKLSDYIKDIDNADEEKLKAIFDMADATYWLLMGMNDEDNWEKNGEEALKIKREILAIYKKVLKEEDEKIIQVMDDMAFSLAIQDKWEDTVSLRKEILELRRKTAGDEDARTIEAMELLASDLCIRRPEEAIPIRERLLEIKKRVADENRQYFGEDDERTIKAMKEVVSLLNDLKREEDALRVKEEILAIRRKKPGNDAEETIDAMRDVAISLGQMERKEEELKVNEEILSIRRSSCGAANEKTLEAMRAVAWNLRELERRDEELKIYEDILCLRREDCRDDDERTVGAIEDVARLLREREEYVKELPLRQQLFNLHMEKRGEANEQTLNAMIYLADTYIALHKYESALQVWEQIANIRKQHRPPSEVLAAWHSIAYIQCLAGNIDEAVKKENDALPICRNNPADKKALRDTLCVLAICVALEIMSRHEGSWKQALHERAMGMFAMTQMHEEMHRLNHGYFDGQGIIALLRELAEYLRKDGHHEDAKVCLCQSLDICKAAYGEEDSRTAEVAAELKKMQGGGED